MNNEKVDVMETYGSCSFNIHNCREYGIDIGSRPFQI